VFEAWRSDTGHPGAKLTDNRRRKITARLREGYTVAELLLAVQGWRHDPWPDRRQHNDLVVLLRDGAQVEKFRDLALKARNGTRSPADRDAALRRAIEQDQAERERLAVARTTQGATP
jgi:hypothetical protein